MLRLQPQSYDWALKHIERYGDTDIFPVPFEFSAIRSYWDQDVKPQLSKQNVLDWHLRSYRRLLTPKHRYGFRISTQLDPLDSITFTALMYEIGMEIENFRIAKEQNIAFSNRFDPDSDGQMYNPNLNWETFQNHCREQAESDVYQYVVVADIADFFPRIYSHPLEQALGQAIAVKTNHVRAIKRCLSQLNGSVSYGIPVGQAASRLLAELVLDDVDRGLMGEGINHCRFVDDFRIFCETEKDALAALATLANLLFENHGLTLQQHKTRVMTTEHFENQILKNDADQEISGLSDQFNEILSQLDLSNPYEEFNFNELDENAQEQIRRMNLEEILEQHLEEVDEIDISLVRFLLKRLTSIGSQDIVDSLISNIHKLYPVVKEVMGYFQTIELEQSTKHQIGSQLLNICTDSFVGHLEFNTLWILNTFTNDNEWNNEGRFIRLYSELTDQYTQRELILAMGRAGLDHWFRPRRRNASELTPWLKRAFLAAASCLPGDQAQHWYRSLPRLDLLETVVTKWATSNRFS
ncbi:MULTISPECIES: RNA-directed DNA polymerase [unclassified Oceanobacillus]|uniref:RNA-directed DNA polymerase n=1 Tax=unclassified Oceanobacillus TaxID=2630292 RepID=UPI001BE9E1FB|nr:MULTISPECIES: RNA-directed DNA polymerase [unclassified Oceanobacillus]MBT2600021.1 RNA-directed DNA polymerase [Oceanobacillus sp. ISL-74]MBT2652531.1 RNA-directed DNA polymerase [Oceanobacillus sp. ISL-73]